VSNVARALLGLLAAGGAVALGAHDAAQVAHAQPATPRTDACPPEMTRAATVCIDRFEAHLARLSPGGALVSLPPYERPEGADIVAVAKGGVKPQAYVSRVEATRACDNAGKRLCSVSEWHQACRGPAKATYPYGATYQKDRCNTGKPHLLSLLYGKDPKRWRYDEHFNNPELARRPGFLAATAEYDGCVSAYGAFDMVGNLHEWVSDRVDPSLAEKLPLTDGIRARLRANTGKGIFMGGFFSTTNQHGDGCHFVTIAHEPTYHDYSTGFRCCKDPSATAER
jgi:formylglycine-generating enzyme